MKRIIYTLCVCFALCVPVTFADTHCANDPGSVVVFGNGIMNNEADADRSLYRIQELLRANTPPVEFEKFEFDLAYNQSYGLMRDLYESVKQRVGQDNAVVSFWRWLGGREAVPDAVQEELLRMATRFDFSTMVGDEDLADHLALYRNSVHAGKKVVVIAHSQGNFFANAAHNILYTGATPIQSNSFGLVCVADPASSCAGDGPYTTLVEDGVIAAISLATVTGILPPLPPNLTNILSGARTSDWRGHNFINEYMAEESRSVTKIMPDITDMMNGLAQPAQENCTLPPSPPPEPPISSTPMCDDNIDNDGDGLIDWNGGWYRTEEGLGDPGCTDPRDNSEFNLLIRPR